MYIKIEQKHNPVLSEMRDHKHFMRVVASVILFVFSFVFYSPAVYATIHSQEVVEQSAREKAKQSFEHQVELLESNVERLNKLLRAEDVDKVEAVSTFSEVKGFFTDDALLESRVSTLEQWESLQVFKSEIETDYLSVQDQRKSETITESDYTNTDENTDVIATYLSQYDPSFWEGHTIIEPNDAIESFKVVE